MMKKKKEEKEETLREGKISIEGVLPLLGVKPFPPFWPDLN